LKNPPRDEKTKTNAQKRPPVEDTKSKTLQNRSQVTTPRKKGIESSLKTNKCPIEEISCKIGSEM
jgi:hypothetical protein